MAYKAGSSKTVPLSGFKELQKTLEDLPLEIAGPIVRASFRAGAKIVLEEAQRRAPHRNAINGTRLAKRVLSSKTSGAAKKAVKTVRESIRIIAPSRKIKEKTQIIFMVMCLHWAAHWFENGTVERVQSKTGRRTGRILPMAFMRGALDSKGDAAIAEIRAQVLARTDRAAARIAKNNRSV